MYRPRRSALLVLAFMVCFYGALGGGIGLVFARPALGAACGAAAGLVATAAVWLVMGAAVVREQATGRQDRDSSRAEPR